MVGATDAAPAGLALVLLTALLYATGLGTGWIGERIAALLRYVEENQ